ERPALGGGGVVAADEDDERVIELAQILNLLHHAADFMVDVGEERSVDVGLSDEELLFHVGELIPWLDEVRRPGCQLRVGRDDTEPLLVGEDLSRIALYPSSKRCMSLIFLIHSGVG